MQKRTQAATCIWPDCPKPQDTAKLCEAHGYIVWAAFDAGSLAEVDKRRRAHTIRAAATQPKTGTIYYLQVGTHIKIGWTQDLSKRMRAYAPNSVLLATHPGTRGDETALHRKFAVWRSHGNEWYPHAPVILQHIDRVKAEHGQPPNVPFGARPVTVPTPRPKQYVGGAHRGPGRNDVGA